MVGLQIGYKFELLSAKVAIEEGLLPAKTNTEEKGSINLLFKADTLLERVIFSVPRTIFYIVAPFPQIDLWSYWDEEKIESSIRRTVNHLNPLLFLFLLPAFYATVNSCIRKPAYDNFWSPIILYLTASMAFANGALMFHQRWRSSLGIFWLAIILAGWRDKRKYWYLIFIVPLLGTVMFFVLKALAYQ